MSKLRKSISKEILINHVVKLVFELSNYTEKTEILIISTLLQLAKNFICNFI